MAINMLPMCDVTPNYFRSGWQVPAVPGIALLYA